jgi:predicted metal-dependent HD superfamily phosphohydrolase
MAGDVDGALRYAYERLTHELDARFEYHNIFHTFEDVMPAALHLADAYDIAAEKRDLLRVGVAFHDLGLCEGAESHEQRGVEHARLILPAFGFSPADIEVIAGLILATRLPQSPTNLLEEIIADADLDVLGRDDFLTRNDILFRETANNGDGQTKRDWLAKQIAFLRNHRYFTQAARDRRDAGKRRNLAALLDQVV